MRLRLLYCLKDRALDPVYFDNRSHPTCLTDRPSRLTALDVDRHGRAGDHVPFVLEHRSLKPNYGAHNIDSRVFRFGEVHNRTMHKEFAGCCTSYHHLSDLPEVAGL
jgi:hypothetical protein